MMIHKIKVIPSNYNAIVSGIKNFEICKFDRTYKVDDIVIFREWDGDGGKYTGREFLEKIICVSIGNGLYGLDEEHCILGLMPFSKFGTWVKTGTYVGKCSECDCEYSVDYNFCPNCGADMRGEEDE